MNNAATPARDLDTFYCQECAYRFRTVKAAERASFGADGCPKCGGSDIDLGPPDTSSNIEYQRAEAGFADSREP